ncbi:ABC transporter-like protein [Arabidopsis thaliana]|uniref:ABC transporter G family member 37 n=1 Tax=Arabidopsis thaliana TaxID=3702 RepID=AB37G_ARATH|nr:pleiotropic drug resistance 9 [Arabidopsis thaliana]Q9LFH0.1 RecName: Full=ABC transporter G family member 37; Short=ABC transporter ABCG.37; Short=AtABCG37; AltName: Full=Pleiotropic drug resistance protein 9; AltName: Full=Protein ENHANCER OF TIR1-1 AUXIN RESISTANCE 4; AltName: Full=Protein POLAR AUXIN TRANSPORT INHIBITOR SENSITIVE 1 [Arabidopsis thaliana]AEE79095.1 pleiotropic drug resistance 9 [Arabidopsis thaliana]CAB67655.1 ABC transporter-like protein [Arabidopsis thaliana]DAA00877.1 |eukprot:NP_190916.1 pleiotropic drug resistance 9 [Arabidopsis thaliana]
MAHMVGADDIESLRVELAEIGRSIRSSFRRHTSSFRSSSSIYEVENDGDVNDHDAEYALQWAEIERLPTVKRMRSTLLDDGDESMTEKGRRVVDVTKLGAVERHLMIEKLIKHIENDNLKLLKKIRRRIDRVGMELPTIEVRYESLKVVAECEVVEGKALPTLWNTAKRVLSELVKLTGAKTHEAKINIINDVNGIIKPGRLTLLLGPPSCGKTTLLKALSGNLENNLKCSGEISYNGHRLDEFVPQKTSAYISQYDLHIAEMTVRETVDFSARCQGVGSRTDIMMEVSKREKEKGIIPDTEVDAYMKAISVEGLQRSLQTDYILKILGLDICAEILIGDVMRRGISGGQKKRLTTAEMIVGPTKALFMDEITNGLDSSTAFQIVKSLQQFAHISSATVLVSLLQPAPESYDLFDDIMLMAKGRIVYHGPRGEVLNFFEDCGFRCPERKGVADFLQEVISKKDQAQYWWHEDLPYSFVSVEMLSKKFKDLSIGKKIEDTLSKPYDRSKSHKDALSFSVYSLPNWELFIACISREYLLMKRNYFVYIFKTAQLVMAAFITMTVFIRTRMGIDIIHGNSYMSALFFALIILLVDGFPELSMTAQRLAVFYKQKQLCFYPAWAYAIPATVLKVPLSFFESLVWTCLSYYVIGYTPEASRFFKQFILLFAVHFTSISMFRCLAAIFQTVVASITAGSFGILFTFVFAGFVIPPPSMPAWLKWGFWANPLSYGEIGLSVNEFLAPRWNQMQPNNFTLGRTILQTRGMDYNGYMYWVSLCALLGFTVLFNIIFTLALTFLKSPTSSRAMISQDKLSELQGTEKSTEDSSVRKKTTDSPVKTEEEDKMVLPFKPLTVTFQDLNYFVDMPVEMRDQGYDQKKLQLLSDITGAFRPGILTALMGVSGAGKTTLLDVLAGRKTSGYIEGDIRISGFPKVQETFARVSGYCEQTDIHSPNITVEESVIYSAWLRLAPEIDATTKTKFVKQVLETIELDEIKDSLVGVTGVSGLSTEQRKRLTIAVELVANPSIIFMDEPTTGLDARAAAIVMRAVKNVADTGRTIVCTIHQPSIDIFEAFDELVLLKRGGRMIYTGPLGQHSRHIIEYFESVPEIPKIKDNHNPATWMLDVSSQSVEIELGVDFAKIYHDSALYKRNSELVKQLSQPDSGSSDIQFKRTFAQSWWGQFKSILWKMNLSYWRSPSYNLMRMMHTLVSSLIFGALFWKQGQNLDTQQSMFTVFGAIYGLVLFLGINNCASALQYFETERNVMYRERFAGMYSATAYALGQVVTEIPYIFIQAAEFVIVTYPMIGFYPSAYKVFWSLYSMFCSLLTFNYLAMFLVSITPNFMVAAILQSLFYVGFNLFSGFLIPQTQVPGWWIWLYYLTPTSWTLNGFISSQYGDIHEEINVFGQSTTVARFLKDYFGFHHDLLAVTAVVQIAFPIALASMFAFFVGKLNFQRR